MKVIEKREIKGLDKNCEKRSMISIIVPVYNSAKTLEKCIKSILTSKSDIELILINDGSTDDSWGVCEKYAKEYTNVQAYSQENKGVSEARNLGIEKATGEWIGFVDSDDWIEEGYFDKMNEVSQNYSVDLIMSYYEKNKIINRIKGVLDVHETGELVLGDKNVGGYCWNKLFRRQIIIDNDLRFDPSVKLCEDVLFVMQYVQHMDCSYVFLNALYHYEETVGSGKYSWKKMATAINAYENILELPFVRKDLLVKRSAENNLIKHCIRVSRSIIKEKRDTVEITEFVSVARKYMGCFAFRRGLSIKYKFGLIVLLIYPKCLQYL